jgi:glutamate/aspartate transport system substrate-binding protein
MLGGDGRLGGARFLLGSRDCQAPEGALTGTLQKVRASGEVAIGYREASIPFSYSSARGEPIGTRSTSAVRSSTP